MEEQIPIPGTEPNPIEQILILLDQCEQLEQLEQEAEDKAKTLRSKIDEIQMRIIPDMMRSLGMSQFSLPDGRKVTINQSYFASIPKAKQEEAYRWLVENGHGGVIKEDVFVAPSLKGQLDVFGVPYRIERKVSPQTLRSLVRELTETGQNYPMDTLGVYIETRAKLKKAAAHNQKNDTEDL